MDKQCFQLLQRIEEATKSGQHAKALRLILTNFGRFEDTGPMRERIAIILAQRGRKKEAVGIFDLVARHYANRGNPTRAMAAIKQMHALQPDATVLLDHFSALYNIRSPYLDKTRRAMAPSLYELKEAPDLAGTEPALGESELLMLAVERASQKQGMLAQPKPQDLPPLPFLSLLPSNTLRRVLDFVSYEIFPEPQPVLEEGEINRDLLWVVSDELTVQDGDDVLRLPSGAFLGLASAVQGASPSMTIMSRKGSEILRLSAEAIAALSQEFEDFPNRLATMRRHALTEGLLQRHALFAGMSDEQRLDFIGLFTGLHVKEREVLIEQDRPSPGLFIVLDGNVDIVRHAEDWEFTLANLSDGEMFGEVGLVEDQPATAQVLATRGSHLLYLSRKEFKAASQRFGNLEEYARQLAAQRLEELKESVSAQDVSEVQ